MFRFHWIYIIDGVVFVVIIFFRKHDLNLIALTYSVTSNHTHTATAHGHLALLFIIIVITLLTIILLHGAGAASFTTYNARLSMVGGWQCAVREFLIAFYGFYVRNVFAKKCIMIH